LEENVDYKKPKAEIAIKPPAYAAECRSEQGEWVSGFLTAYQHNGYAMPFRFVHAGTYTTEDKT